MDLNMAIVKQVNGNETRNVCGGFPIHTIIQPRKYRDALALGFKTTQEQKPFKATIQTARPSDLEALTVAVKDAQGNALEHTQDG